MQLEFGKTKIMQSDDNPDFMFYFIDSTHHKCVLRMFIITRYIATCLVATLSSLFSSGVGVPHAATIFLPSPRLAKEHCSRNKE